MGDTDRNEIETNDKFNMKVQFDSYTRTDKNRQCITGGIFYCRDSADFNVSASNKLSCYLTVKCFEIGNKNIPPTLAFSFQAGTEYRVPLDYGDVQKPVRTHDHQVLPNGKITFLKFQNQKIYIPFYLHPQQMDRFWENKEVTALWFMRYLTTHLTILKA